MTKKSKLVLAMASMLGITAGATAVSGFAWFTTTKKADVDISNIGVYSKSSALAVTFKEALVGCADAGSTSGDIDVKTSGYETFTGNGTNKTFTLKDIPDAKPTVKVGNADVDPTKVSWTTGTKVVTLTTDEAPADGVTVKITYAPFSGVLTDVSSVDGQTIYKPTWTATGEGRYATAVPTVQEGFLRFSMTLEASGSSDLKVYLNLPTISPSGSTEADAAAAKIARVSIVEDADQDLDVTANVTRLVLQNNDIANSKGIDSTFVAAGKTGTQGTTAVFDMNSISVGCTNFANPDTADKSVLSLAPDMTAAKNYITTVPAGGQTDIIVTVWLEGTNGNVDSNLYGSYDAANDLNPLNGSIDVSLPLIAF